MAGGPELDTELMPAAREAPTLEVWEEVWEVWVSGTAGALVVGGAGGAAGGASVSRAEVLPLPLPPPLLLPPSPPMDIGGLPSLV